MDNFCTLFDSFYLSRGLVMYESLKAQSRAFHLFIFAFDDISYRILSGLQLTDATIISLQEFETQELKEVKKNRTKAEYCWTCTPSVIMHVLEKYKTSECTYVDADLCFYSDPAVLISEMKNNAKTVLITEHRFSSLPKIYEEKRSGRFCVQFITFTNNENSLKILDEWRMQCIDWCYARHEDGKFGDQKYLDVWPQKYKEVHILQHQGGGIAPWNLTQYSFTKNDGKLMGENNKTGQHFPVVFYHFQYVKTLGFGYYDTGWYYISPNVKRLFYEPYIALIQQFETTISDLNSDYRTGVTTFRSDSFKDLIKTGFKKIFRYNVAKYKN